MPKGQPGTLTHGKSAYDHGRCRCRICSDAKREYRRFRMATGDEMHADWRRWKAAWRARTGKH